MKNRKMMTAKILLSLFVVFAFAFQAQAGETYKLALSLAITGPTSDAGSSGSALPEGWRRPRSLPRPREVR